MLRFLLFSLFSLFVTSCISASTQTPAAPDPSPTPTLQPIRPRVPTLTPVSASRTPVGLATPGQGSAGGDVTPRISQACLDGDVIARLSLTATPEGPRIRPPQGVPTPEPFAPAPVHADAALEDALRNLLGADVDGVGIVAIDLQTGRTVRINPDKVFDSASIFKLMVMFEVMHQKERGILGLNETVVLTPYYEAFGLGPRMSELCQELTIHEAMTAMLTVSDNATAVLLQDVVGAGNINNSMEALGLEVSRLTPEGIRITAGDMAVLLEAIALGEAVSRDASQAMLDYMAMETFDYGLKSGAGEDAVVAHKTGRWTDALHDAGIVFAPEAAYVAVILTDGRSLDLIEQVSRLLYEHFAN